MRILSRWARLCAPSPAPSENGGAFDRSAAACDAALPARERVSVWSSQRSSLPADPPVPRILTSVIPALLQRPGQVLDSAEILVVSRIFAGEQCVHRVMKIIAPLRWHAQSAFATRTQYPCIVQIALRDQRNDSPGSVGESVNLLRQFGEKRKRAGIKDSVNGVEPQHIDMESF